MLQGADVQNPPRTRPLGGDIETDLLAAASCRLPVLVTGSDEFAREIASRLHRATSNPDGPFLAIDCAGPEMEVKERIDAALSQPGTVLLEHIDALSPPLQRILAESVGPTAPRLVTSSSTNLLRRCEDGTFDERTFYRLNAVHIIEGDGPL